MMILFAFLLSALVRINPRTGQQTELPLSPSARGLAVSKQGLLYVGVPYGGIRAYDPVTFQFHTVIASGYYADAASRDDWSHCPISLDENTGDIIVALTGKYVSGVYRPSAIYRVNPSNGIAAQVALGSPTSRPIGAEAGNNGTVYAMDAGFLAPKYIVAIDPSGSQTVLVQFSDYPAYGLDVYRASAPTLRWTGASGANWVAGDSANWQQRFATATYTNDQPVTFDDTADTGSVNLPANVSPSSVRVANLVLTYTLSGGAITGATGLTKDCLGTLILNNVNTYNGPTLINAGTLRLGARGDLSDLSEIRLAAGATFEREVSVGGNYAGRDLRSAFVGGLASKASILAGNNINGGDQVVAMQWRTRNANETYPSQTTPPIARAWGLVSDVITVSGMAGGYADPGRTDAFALQISYDPSQLVLLPGSTEESIAAGGCIYVAWLNPTGWNGADPLWVNARDGNFGNNAALAQEGYLGSFAAFEAGYGTDLNAYIGAWGVDTVNDVAWSVLNHNSDFAVVPEPATLSLLALGGLAMLRRRGRK
jgi:autotransporter-associated beta strand protein